MAIIHLVDNNYGLVPEGEHIFKITSVDYNEPFGKLNIAMQTAKGGKHTERYRFKRQDGSENTVALGIFSFFARTAMDNFELEDIDPEALVGKYIKGKIEHTKAESTKEPGKKVTFTKFTCESSVSGFELNLDSILE